MRLLLSACCKKNCDCGIFFAQSEKAAESERAIPPIPTAPPADVPPSVTDMQHGAPPSSMKSCVSSVCGVQLSDNVAVCPTCVTQ
jgi:hypothetical protein